MDYVWIQYAPVQREFDRKFTLDLIKLMRKGCESVYKNGKLVKERGKNKHKGEGYMPLKEIEDVELVEMLYNNGKGKALDFKVNDLYSFAIHVEPQERKVGVTISVPLPFLRKVNGKKVVEDLINRSKSVYAYLRPEYAVGDEEGLLIDKKIDYSNNIFWLNFYGPKIVEQIGREKLRNVPYGTIDELADGGVLLIRGRTPDENSEHSKELKNYLFGRGIIGRLFGR